MKLRFLLFCCLVLGMPAVLMAANEPRLNELGKLALILGPALAGTLLGIGLRQPTRDRLCGVCADAVLVTLGIASLGLVSAMLLGAAEFSGTRLPPERALAAVALAALTSVVEELGWARGGLALANAALGRAIGVATLGVVWAAWHLIPTLLHSGLFVELEAAPPAMLVVFVITCVLYRELLTRFAERGGSWLAAAAAHAAPNMLFAALMSGGLVVLTHPDAWMAYPAPGGIGFALFVLLGLYLRRGRVRPAAAVNG